jgi:Protein of unknown function (DUF2946)
MYSQRWVSWIAVIGMLLHAATVARHNVIMFRHALPVQEAAALSVPPGVICHDEGQAGAAGKAQGDPAKSPAGGQAHCPICLGLASAHAMPASEAPALRVPQAAVMAASVRRDTTPAPAAFLLRPSNRGPPSIA